jgi:WD40 repeat protein
MKCLEKDRTRRYATANGLAMDLRRHLDCEPVLARPPNQLYRFRKFARRNKVALAAITSVAVALLLGVVVSTWQAIRATRASASEAVQHKLADLQLSLQAWEEGDLQRASDLIEDCRPAPGQAPSFEWRYLQKLCQDQSFETFGNTNHPCRAAMFIDRDSLLLNDAKTLTLLDLSRRTTQLLLEDPDGISSPESCAGNTNLLATVTDDGRIKVWDLVAGRVQVELAGQPRAPLASAAQFHTLTLARDGRRLAWAGSDYSVKLWDVETNNPKPVRTLHRYASWACNPVFSSDGRYLFSGGSESTIRTWNAATGEAEGTPLEGHTSWVYALALSPDGLRLASGGADSAVIIWDVLTRKPVTTLFGHMAWVSALAFSPDGQRLASGGGDHTIRLWNLKTSQHLSLLRGQGAALTWLSFSPDGQWLVSRSRDGLVKRWRTSPDQEANTLTGGQSSLEVAWSPDGRRLAAVGGSDFGVSLWDRLTRSSTRLLGHTGAAMYAAFSPDGRLLATGSHDQTVRLWDLREHQPVATLTNGFPVGSLAFSPDGQTLIVGGSKHHFLVGDRGGLQFWDVSSRQPTGSLPGDASDIVQVALSDRGTLLATGHTNGRVSLWNAHTRRLLHRFESQFGSSVLSLAFSPAEALLAASDRAGHIVLYNTATLKVVPPPLRGHTGRVTSLAFSPDGQTLASAGEGGGLKLWHVATHQVALTLKGHRSAVKGIAFSRDGNFMASCALDGTVRLWPAADLETDAAAKVMEKPTIKQP